MKIIDLEEIIKELNYNINDQKTNIDSIMEYKKDININNKK